MVRSSCTDEILMILPPPPCFTIWRAAAWEQRNGPVKSTAIIFCQRSRGNSRNGRLNSMPALLTRMSIRPKVDTAWSIRFWTCTGSDTSAWTATLRPPAAVIFCSVSSAVPGLPTKSTTTAAPSFANFTERACPMPLAAPVTMATLPCSLMTVLPAFFLHARAMRCAGELA